MALIQCPECKKEVSDKSAVCIHCGYPLSNDDTISTTAQYTNVQAVTEKSNKQKKKALPIVVVLIAVVLLVVAAAIFLNGDKSNDSGHEALDESTIIQNDKQLPTVLEFEFIDYNEFSNYWVDGVFRCGTDFEPGEYYILPLFGSGAIYDVEESPDDFSWSYERLLRKISVDEGEYVNVAFGGIMVPADDVDTSNWPHYGVFLVGEDILAGEYKMETITDEYKTDLYWVSGIDGAYQLNDGCVEDVPLDCYSLFSSQEYITVEDGQYIIITNLKLTNIEVSEHVTQDSESDSDTDESPCDINGHSEGEWELTEEATLNFVGVEEVFCTVCGESLDSRGTERKSPKVIGTSFNFTDEEFIDWINSWDKKFEVNSQELGMSDYSSDNTCYEINLWSTDSEGILILNHDDEGYVSGVMAYFEDFLESAAFISVIAENIEYDFSIDSAGEELIDNDMAYMAGDIVVMRLVLSDDMEVTLLAPFRYVGEVLEGVSLTENDCLVFIENNNEDFAEYNFNVQKYIRGEFGKGSCCWFYDTDDFEEIEDDLGNVITFRGIIMGESTEDDVIRAYGIGDIETFDREEDIFYRSMASSDVEDIKYLGDTARVMVYDYRDEYQIAFYIDNDGIVDFITYFDGLWY